MAKFFKSIFSSADRRKSTYDGEEDEKSVDSPPPMDGKRQLSISRSGRMRQANKKRHSLTLELYGDTIDIDGVEKPKSVQYHVHGPHQMTAPVILSTSEKRLEVNQGIEATCPDTNAEPENLFQVSLEKKLKALALESGSKSPEEEIDNAFDIIDKS